MKKPYSLALIIIIFVLFCSHSFAADYETPEEWAEETKKLNIGAGFTAIVAGTANNAPNGNRADASLTADLELGMVFFSHGRGFINLEGALGTGLNDNVPFNASIFGPPNGDANPGVRLADMELAEVFYEGNYWENRFFFNVGLLDPAAFFDTNEAANSETTQFLNAGFVNNGAVELPGYALGLAIRVLATPWLSLQAGIFEGDSDWDSIQSDPFYIGEIVLHPVLFRQPGNYRFYAWQNHTDHVNASTGSTTDAGYGFGLSLDQKLADWLTFFGRFGYQSPNIYQGKIAFSGGFEVSGSVFGRMDDATAIAFGQAINSDTVAARNNEAVLEWYYRLQINEHVGLSPDIQWYFNPGASAANSKVLVFALRGQFDF